MKIFILSLVGIIINIYTSHAQVAGCPNPAALNDDSLAMVNDGSENCKPCGDGILTL